MERLRVSSLENKIEDLNCFVKSPTGVGETEINHANIACTYQFSMERAFRYLADLEPKSSKS